MLAGRTWRRTATNGNSRMSDQKTLMTLEVLGAQIQKCFGNAGYTIRQNGDDDLVIDVEGRSDHLGGLAKAMRFGPFDGIKQAATVRGRLGKPRTVVVIRRKKRCHNARNT